jgi:hypothetical protein
VHRYRLCAYGPRHRSLSISYNPSTPPTSIGPELACGQGINTPLRLSHSNLQPPASDLKFQVSLELLIASSLNASNRYPTPIAQYCPPRDHRCLSGYMSPVMGSGRFRPHRGLWTRTAMRTRTGTRARTRIQNTEYRTQNPEHRIQNTEYRTERRI